MPTKAVGEWMKKSGRMDIVILDWVVKFPAAPTTTDVGQQKPNSRFMHLLEVF